MPNLPPLPRRIAALKKDHRGFPVPWFVQWLDNGWPQPYGQGTPDFRVIDSHKLYANMRAAHKPAQCWICGQPLGKYRIFAIGPMCGVNRTTSEPPSHRECAEFAVRACPFLTKPRMRRNEVDLPEHKEVGGLPIERNPGVTALWQTEEYKAFKAGDGYLIRLGDPERVDWWAEGRIATREEVVASVESGMPFLREMCDTQGDHDALSQFRDRFDKYLPRAA